MRSNSNLRITICLLAIFSVSIAVGQSNQEWIAYKQKCGIPAGMAYNDWVAAGSKCNSGSTASGSATAPPGLTPQQQMGMQAAQLGGYMIGQGLHNILFGQPKPLAAPLDPAIQQRALAAEQLNNSGIYLLKRNDYAGAINEFQKALDISPSDQNIQGNLALAKRQLKDAAAAARTSGELGQFLGKSPANAGLFDLQLAQSSAFKPNASALSSVNLDAGVVDLRGATRTSPQALASQIDGILSNKSPASTSPRANVVVPGDKDMELLFGAVPTASAQSNVVLPQDKDMQLLFNAPPASAQSNVVLPQDKDMELLFNAGPPASAQPKVVLPQDKDMELLFGAGPPAPKTAPAPEQPHTKPATDPGQPHN